MALDGASGAGKSTLAPLLTAELAAALIPTDDFFSAHIPDADWDRFTIPERYAQVLDWARIRMDILAPLRAGRPARWHAFDFASGLRADGTYGMEAAVQARQPADVIVLEGAYSAAPYLADLLDLRVLLDLPRAQRHARLRAREDPEFLRAWHARWDEVEAYYRRKGHAAVGLRSGDRTDKLDQVPVQEVIHERHKRKPRTVARSNLCCYSLRRRSPGGQRILCSSI
ncbi:MAG: hypothetical protein R2838_09700 [Caldilineaceae bacterium]